MSGLPGVINDSRASWPSLPRIPAIGAAPIVLGTCWTSWHIVRWGSRLVRHNGPTLSNYWADKWRSPSGKVCPGLSRAASFLPKALRTASIRHHSSVTIRSSSNGAPTHSRHPGDSSPPASASGTHASALLLFLSLCCERHLLCCTKLSLIYRPPHQPDRSRLVQTSHAI